MNAYVDFTYGKIHFWIYKSIKCQLEMNEFVQNVFHNTKSIMEAKIIILHVVQIKQGS